MERFIEAPPHTRITFTCSDSFRLWTAVKGQKHALVGPRHAATRTTSYTVPAGAFGLIVETAADGTINIHSMQNLDAREVADKTRLLTEVDSEANWSFDSLANRIALLMQQRNGEEYETIEEASDFDIEDDDTPPWAHYDVDYVPVIEEEPNGNPGDDIEPPDVPETASEASGGR